MNHMREVPDSFQEISRFLFFTAIEDHMVTGNPIGNDKIKDIDT